MEARNQFTGHITREAFVDKLLSGRSERVLCALGVITCRRGKGPGFHANAGGYVRVSFNGDKVCVHTIVLEVTQGPAPGNRRDASHLCGNPLGALNLRISLGRTVRLTYLDVDVLGASL